MFKSKCEWNQTYLFTIFTEIYVADAQYILWNYFVNVSI